MKITFITNNFPPIVDGVGDYTYHLAHEFIKNGQEVNVICSAKPEIIEFVEENKLNYKIYSIVKKWDIQGICVAYQKIKHLQPDYVVLQYVPYSYQSWGMPILMPLLFLLTKISRIPIVTIFHEIAVRLEWSNPKLLIVGIIQRIIAYLMAAISEKMITSIPYYQQMLSIWRKKISLVPVGSNISPMQVSPEQVRVFKRRFANHSTLVITTFGGGMDRRHDLLLTAFADLLKKVPDCLLVLLGKFPKVVGVQVNQLIDQLGIKNQVLITGKLSSEDIYQYLACSDLFVLYENVNKKGEGGLSIKSGAFAAACAAGLPIISTKGTLTDQLLLNSRHVSFFEPTPNALTHLLNEIMQNDTKRKKMKKHSTKFYQKYLSWSKIALGYKKAFLKSEEEPLAVPLQHFRTPVYEEK